MAERTRHITCGHCGGILSSEYWNRRQAFPCPFCGRSILALVFPTFTRGPAAGDPGRRVLENDEQATCFYHPTKQAVIPCDECGRFLCAVCDVDLAGRHICPTCIVEGRVSELRDVLESGRTLYGEIALAIATISGLLVGALALVEGAPWVPLIWAITAPVSLFLALRYWNRPGSLVTRSRLRSLLAVGLSLVQIVVAFLMAAILWGGA